MPSKDEYNKMEKTLASTLGRTPLVLEITEQFRELTTVEKENKQMKLDQIDKINKQIILSKELAIKEENDRIEKYTDMYKDRFEKSIHSELRDFIEELSEDGCIEFAEIMETILPNYNTTIFIPTPN